MTTAAIYARVSTLDQNCALQLTELRTFNERSQWTTLEYVDAGFSGKKRSRPALDRLMKDARLRLFEVVICWKLDRFGRSVRDLVDNILELDRLHIRFICPTQGIDTDDRSPTGRLMLHILMAVAEFERELIRERCVAGAAEYRRAHKEGRVGKDRHSRSGKDLRIGRPNKVFNRERAAKLRLDGKSWRLISIELDVPIRTLRASLAALRKTGLVLTDTRKANKTL